MTTAAVRRRTSWATWLSALALFYTAVAIVLATQDYLLQRRTGVRAVPWLAYVGNRITQWVVWTGWTPFVAWLGGRFRLDREPRAKHWVIHLAALVLLVPVVFLSDIALGELLTLPGSGRTYTDKLVENFLVPRPVLFGWLLVAALTWVLVLILSYAWRFRQERQEQLLETNRLRAELAEAELHALKSQLHPHFLFNALNAISTLAATDPPTARRAVLLLSGLLRRALADTDTQEVTLAQEVEFAREYLEIERIRFSNRLSVEVMIEPGAERLLVPHLLLQPLVENAVRHGVEPKAEPGTIRLEGTVGADGLRLVVTDDGPGALRPSRRAGAGLGLANVRARLTRLYGGGARLECGDRPEGGFRAAVVLPVRERQQPDTVARGVEVHS